jgi:hypothetical protein
MRLFKNAGGEYLVHRGSTSGGGGAAGGGDPLG